MLRKSFLILVVAALVVLGAIVAYALLHLSGPTEMLARAEAMMQRGTPALAIHELTLAERSAPVANDPALRERVWRLRYAAYVALDNPAAALHDIALLLQQGHRDDETLLLDQIRLLAQNGEGERARLAAIAFLADHPGHPRGLELAGEACQTVYQPLLREARELIDLEIGRDEVAAAREALLGFVYRPAGDPEVDRSHTQLERLFAVEPRLVAMWPSVDELLQTVRTRVQEGLGFFWQALDAGEQPVAAFRAVAAALERSGRIDDLLVACELQRILFAHSYVDESGVIAAWLHLRNHQDRAALLATTRWLTDERIAERAADGSLTATSGDLLFARTLAAFRLGDAREIDEALRAIQAVREAGASATTALHLGLAARRIVGRSDDRAGLERSLDDLTRRVLRAPVVPGRPDPAEELLPLLLDSLTGRGAPEPEVTKLLREWQAARPESPSPLLANARYRLALGSAPAALAAITDAARLAPDHPELFELRLSASRVLYRDTRLDGAGLLRQCAQRRQPLPEIEDPIGFYLCAEAAMAQRIGGTIPVAIACARSAIDAFPNATAPRRLLLEALLAKGQFADAARELERAMLVVEADVELTLVALQTQRAAGLPVHTVLRWALPSPNASRALQAELLTQALAHAPQTAARFVDEAMLAPPTAAELRLAAARALCLDGQVARAAAVLDTFSTTAVAGPAVAQPGGGTAGPTSAIPRSEALDLALAETFAAWLTAAATGADDPTLLAEARSRRERLDLAKAPQAALLRAIGGLETTHPDTAWAMLREALPAARPDERSGVDYARAGRLALRAGLLGQAERHWTAALGFADGVEIAEDLSRLLLATGRAERAAEVYSFVQTPRDGALAIRFGRIDLAGGLLGAALLRDPADLLVHATLATFGQVSMVDWTNATGDELAARVELLAILANPHLAAGALARAQGMVAAVPANRTNNLLMARALVDAGQPVAAALIHGALFAGGFANPVLWREVAYAAQRPGYVPDEALRKQVMTAATSGLTGGSPLTLSYGTAAFVRTLQAAGAEALAEQSQLLLWIGAPQAQPCTDADVELIARGHPPALACTILDQVLEGGQPQHRRRVLDRFYELAEQAAQVPAQAERLRATAQRHLQREGALGPIVHFLLSHQPGQRSRATSFALLDAHLLAVAAGIDDQRWLSATVEALVAAIGLDAAIARVEPVLREQPTAIPLWLARADLLCRARRDGVPILQLRAVLAHTEDDDATLELIGLAAAAHALQPDDRARFAALPATLRESPRGRYAAGLLALGEGDAATAMQQLDGAAPHPDGRHLFAWAQACLADGATASVSRAAELFDELRRAYPSSELARNAGSFVRQLAPRAAAAPPSESNR